MSTDSTQLATRPKASDQLAAIIGMDRSAMLEAIKAQCFKGNPQNISDAQLAAFVSIAAEMGVNPLLPGMLYAFPVQGGGIVPMMGPDGVYKKLTEHAEVESWETEVFPADVLLPPTHAVTKIFRKNRERPLQYTALLSEWRVNANGNWTTRPRHMLALRSLKQCARQIIHGVPYDEDERKIMEEVNVTNTVDGAEQPATQRPAPPKRSPRGAAAVVDNPPTNPQAGGKTGVVVEGDFTEGPKGGAQTPAPDAQKDVDAAKEAEDAKLKSDMAAREAKLKADAPKERAPAEQKILDDMRARLQAETKAKQEGLARDSLKDGEERTVVATVKDMQSMVGTYLGVKETPLVQLDIVGDEFNGHLMHWHGGTVDAKKNVTPNPLYVPGAVLRFTLYGKMNNLAKPPKVQNCVKSVEALEGPADEQVEMS